MDAAVATIRCFVNAEGAFDYEYPEEVTTRYAFPVPPEQEVGYSLWMAGQQALKVILRKKKTTPSGKRKTPLFPEKWE